MLLSLLLTLILNQLHHLIICHLNHYYGFYRIPYNDLSSLIKSKTETITISTRSVGTLSTVPLSATVISVVNNDGDGFVPFANNGYWNVVKFDPYTFTPSAAMTTSVTIYYIA